MSTVKLIVYEWSVASIVGAYRGYSGTLCAPYEMSVASIRRPYRGYIEGSLCKEPL